MICAMVGATALGLPEEACGQRTETIARGAMLWNATCNQCHNRRSPLERTDRQWAVIASHMRTRANLTRSEVQAIVAFLQNANGGPEQGRATSGSGPDSTATVRDEKPFLRSDSLSVQQPPLHRGPTREGNGPQRVRPIRPTTTPPGW